MRPIGARVGEAAVCRALIAAVALVALACGLSACGANEAATVTVTQAVPAEAPPPATITVVETETVADDAVETSSEPAEGPPAAMIKVPNVVGVDHQLAQDTMQAAGLYNLAEEDATGQGRLLLWDRNWTVVSQHPSPGTRVIEDQTITLRSKKDDE